MRAHNSLPPTSRRVNREAISRAPSEISPQCALMHERAQRCCHKCLSQIPDVAGPPVFYPSELAVSPNGVLVMPVQR